MYGVKEVGRYNIDYCGKSYDGTIPYQMVIISTFEGDKEVAKKVLYFRDNIGVDGIYIIPPMKTEDQIKRLLIYPDNAKIRAYNNLIIEME